MNASQQAVERTSSDVDVRDLAAVLRDSLPAYSVLVESDERRPYECDGLTAVRELPLLVALPETVEQVQHVLRTCCQRG